MDDEQKLELFTAPVYQADGRIAQTPFKTYEEAMDACREFRRITYELADLMAAPLH